MEQLSVLNEKMVYSNKEVNNNIIRETFSKYGGDKLNDTNLISIILGDNKEKGII